MDRFQTDADSEFTLFYDMGAPNFSLVQQDTGVASGSQTTADWDGLAYNADYEWFVEATDGTEVQTSEIRRFTTTAGYAPAAPASLSAEPLTSSRILLTWTDLADNERGF